MKIRSTRQFKERIDAAFETQRVRDEAKDTMRDTPGGNRKLPVGAIARTVPGVIENYP